MSNRKGKARDIRAAKRAEAEERQVNVRPERTKRYRLSSAVRLLTDIFSA